jgi:DNA gyrase/topoisomerase IV subunit A
VIQNTRLLVNDPNATLKPMTPSYLGFQGNVSMLEDGSWQFTGLYEIESDTAIRITELPPKKWTGTYIEWIRENLIGDSAKCFVVDIIESSSNDFVNILLKTKPDANIRQRDLVKDLKLSTRVDTNFLNVFESSGSLIKCAGVKDVLKIHAECRRIMYRRRLDRQIENAKHEQQIAENRARFLREVKSRLLNPANMTDVELRTKLANDGYYAFDNFDYLERVSLFAMTRDTFAKLEAEAQKCAERMRTLLSTSVEHVWTNELDALESAVIEYERSIIDKRQELSGSKKRKAEPNRGSRKK